MANRNTSGFGLIAAGTVGSTPATQGQGKYYIIAGAGAGGDLFQGCSVRMKAGYITEAQSTRTFLTIGVFNGIFYNAATTLKPTWANWYNSPITPANSENVTCFVIDNPFQLFVGAMSLAEVQANYGKTISLTAAVPTGSETSGQCNDVLDQANIHATNDQWRLLRLAEDSENNDMTLPYTSVVVSQNLGQYLCNTATVGNDWTI